MPAWTNNTLQSWRRPAVFAVVLAGCGRAELPLDADHGSQEVGQPPSAVPVERESSREVGASVVRPSVTDGLGSLPPTARVPRATPRGAQTRVPRTSAGAATTVVLLSVDGLAARFVQDELNAGNLPNFARLQTEGAYTYRAHCEEASSYTLPNHASMLTARRAALGLPASHGLVFNYDPGAATLHSLSATDGESQYVESVFDVVHDSGGYTALFAGKSKFSIFPRSYGSDHGRVDRVGVDNGKQKIDRFELSTDSLTLLPMLLENLESLAQQAAASPNFLVFHYHETDTEGHGNGWGELEYLDALRGADALVGQVLDAMTEHLPEQSVLIVTSDHGGMQFNHDDAENPAIFEVPFFVWGAGIPTGDLYALSTGPHVHPKPGLRGAEAAASVIHNGHAAGLVLRSLGLPPLAAPFYTGLRFE